MSDNFDPFALARQDAAELPPAEQKLLQAFHQLSDEQAHAVIDLLRLAVCRNN